MLAMAARTAQPPSIAFLRSACTGLSPIQTFVSARLNASPAIDPFAAPLKPTFVALSTKSSVIDAALLELAHAFRAR